MRTSWAAAVLLILFCHTCDGAAVGEIPIGGVLRDARLDALNGTPRLLSSYRGKPLLINVWASWCEPCRAEMASLERLAWGEDAKAFAIIGVSTDDYRDRATSWLNQSNATISHYLDHDLQLETMLGARRLPLTVLVNARGVIVEKVYGAREWDSPAELSRLRAAFALNVAHHK